jgi:D-alanine-D-alanine ligase-like ATP-grasp enzyme
LLLAARCGELADLGYLGVDVVLDRVHGPMMLELNARPGLAIQLANGFGMGARLQKIAALDDIPVDAVGRARLARDMFAQGEIRELSL